MLIAVTAQDRKGALDIRLANRELHLAYLNASEAVVLAGPLMDENDDMIGSLIVLEVADMAEAEAWAAADPYAKAGLFETVNLHKWKRVIG
ncbi:MAG: YciI family protein [Loktanella sp.]|nr:YciI family protein [Loktanella sp.]